MLVVDIEATGTDPRVHSIVSIGALDLAVPTNRFYRECRIFPDAHVMDEALAVNGYTTEEITDASKPSEAEIVAEFFTWIESLADRTPVGQNVSFDREFLRMAAERAGIAFPLSYRTIDTHTLCYMHMTRAGHDIPFDAKRNRTGLNLDAILTYCGIPEEPKPHNALTGACCHAEVASRLLFDTPLLPEFTSHPIPWSRG